MGRCQIGCHSDLHATPKTSVGTKLLCGQLRRHSRHRPALTDPVAGRLGHIRDRVIGRAPLASEPRDSKSFTFMCDIQLYEVKLNMAAAVAVGVAAAVAVAVAVAAAQKTAVAVAAAGCGCGCG